MQKEILPFVTQYNPSVPNLKMEKWHLIDSQPKLREMFKEPPIIYYKKDTSLRDILVRAKLWSISSTLRVDKTLLCNCIHATRLRDL